MVRFFAQSLNALYRPPNVKFFIIDDAGSEFNNQELKELFPNNFEIIRNSKN